MNIIYKTWYKYKDKLFKKENITTWKEYKPIIKARINTIITEIKQRYWN